MRAGRKRIALALAALAGAGIPLLAEPQPSPGRWKLETDSRDVVLRLKANETVEGWMDSVTPQLTVACRNGEPALAIETGIPPHPARDKDRQLVALRFDRGRLVTETFGLSPDRQSLLFAYPVALTRKLMEHERLAARLTHLDTASSMFTFDLHGLREEFGPVEQACRIDFEDPEEIMRAGANGVGSPRLIEESYVEPELPLKARRDKVDAQVILMAVAREDGTIEDLEVVQCSREGYGFEDAALAAVGQWRYEPAEWLGRPVPVRFMTLIYFTLEDD